MTKHYIRIDAEKNITHGFSDKFEKPVQGDICINENAPRHFPKNEMFPDGMKTEEGYPRYTWDSKKKIPALKTEEQIYTLGVRKVEKKQEIKNERTQAERLYRLLKPLIDGGNAESIESALIAQSDAAKNETELEAIKWG